MDQMTVKDAFRTIDDYILKHERTSEGVDLILAIITIKNALSTYKDEEEILFTDSVCCKELQDMIDILEDFDKENFEDKSVGIFGDPEMKIAVPVAVAALREKIKREEGCDYCIPAFMEQTKHMYTTYNFCPKCGKKLKDE